MELGWGQSWGLLGMYLGDFCGEAFALCEGCSVKLWLELVAWFL